MTTTNAIAKFLGFTENQYWDEYVSRYMRWCMNYSAKFNISLQVLLANTAVNKWYNERHEELEYQAYESLHPIYGKIEISKAKAIYNAVMIELFDSYPKPLFEAAKKLEIINTVSHDPGAN